MNRTARLLAILLTVVIVGVGIYAAYETGFDRGAVAASIAGDNGNGTVVVPIDGFRGPYGWHGGFGFFPFLLFILLIGLFRPWRPRGGPQRGSNGGGGWGRPDETLAREMMETRMSEWHKQAHNEGDANRSGS